MKKSHIIGYSIGGFVLFLIVMFILGLYGLGWFKFFGPKTENIKWQIFENTKSYQHGIQQDLGKYYNEYQRTDESGKAVIRATIQMRFAEVDAQKLTSPQLRAFLEETRGY